MVQEGAVMTGAEVQWLISIGVGIVTGAATAGMTVGLFKGRVTTRLDDVEKELDAQAVNLSGFINHHDTADARYRSQCHNEIMTEIRALRLETRSSFDSLTATLLNAAQTGGRRRGDPQ